MRLSPLALVLLCSTAYGQITGPDLVPQGQRIVMSVKLAEGERAAWLAEAGGDVKKFNETSAYGWGTTAKANVYRAVVIPADKDAEPVIWAHTVTIGEAPAPPVPVNTLRQLAGDKATALAAVYNWLAQGEYESAALFRRTEENKLKDSLLTIHGAKAAIAKKISDVLLDADELDDTAHQKLIDELLAISADLGHAPQPPPVDPPVDPPPVDPNSTPVSFDGFHVVFLDESGDRPTWLYDLTALPSVETYLNTYCAGGAKGWRRWDKDTPLDNAPPNLRELAKLSTGATPAVVIAAHKRAVLLPLTKQSEAELLATLKKYGDQ